MRDHGVFVRTVLREGAFCSERHVKQANSGHGRLAKVDQRVHSTVRSHGLVAMRLCFAAWRGSKGCRWSAGVLASRGAVCK
jgi:hypothetical protein